jgi:hypothetical protein
MSLKKLSKPIVVVRKLSGGRMGKQKRRRRGSFCERDRTGWVLPDGGMASALANSRQVREVERDSGVDRAEVSLDRDHHSREQGKLASRLR